MTLKYKVPTHLVSLTGAIQIMTGGLHGSEVTI